ncbi:hypothetical protein FISHEDRAFT_34977 [Fistulina hepatica ATCC 64428]|uniref:Spherulation-specific family 4 n=1 Tax=Fistulina hepatica ATCC 64428 TaxID=1128425 RepID=A0A0D7AP83_9AGAR|nr:hypothetical protein FISHEDRAFT_34977 [Fistulina hepatica ATCC 64428]
MLFARVQTIFLLSCFHIAAASLLPTGVIFPLYIYPDGNCSVWSELLDSIAEYDTLPFYVIVNPSSGPGDENSQPDASYQTCIAELLNTGSNVHAVGYVLTDYGSRSEQDVLADIATYAQWDSDYRPSGIFFDQASYSASEVSTYTTYAENARSSFSDALVILNPGTATDSGYYAIADLIVTTENDYDSFRCVQI